VNRRAPTERPGQGRRRWAAVWRLDPDSRGSERGCGHRDRRSNTGHASYGLPWRKR